MQFTDTLNSEDVRTVWYSYLYNIVVQSGYDYQYKKAHAQFIFSCPLFLVYMLYQLLEK